MGQVVLWWSYKVTAFSRSTARRNNKAYLKVLLHHRNVTVLAAHGVVQTALVKVLLRDVQVAVIVWAIHQRVLAVQHHVVVHIDPLLDPIAARLGVWTLDDELVKHGLQYLGHGQRLPRGVGPAPTCRTRLLGVVLGVPGVVQTLAAEIVLAGELDGPVEGRVADEAHEVAVAG